MQIIPTNLVTNSFIYFFCSIVGTKTKNQQDCGLVTRNISNFCLQRVALYFNLKGMPNQIDFYKSILLYVFPARIKFSWVQRVPPLHLYANHYQLFHIYLSLGNNFITFSMQKISWIYHFILEIYLILEFYDLSDFANFW